MEMKTGIAIMIFERLEILMDGVTPIQFNGLNDEHYYQT